MTRTEQPPSVEEPRWSVKFETGKSVPSGRKPDRIRGVRVFVMSTFLVHLMVYGLIMSLLFLINLIAWDGFLWAIFPALGWGAFLAAHGGVAWLTANAGVSGRMVDRARNQTAPRYKADSPQGELQQIVHAGLRQVDEMRLIGRRMRTSRARRDAVEAVDAIENTLLALENQTEELPLAREFAHAFLDPAWQIFVEYDRLSQRQIESAKPLLLEVETTDLPRIAQRVYQLHERVHRGTMIDLQVAREMLNLESGS